MAGRSGGYRQDLPTYGGIPVIVIGAGDTYIPHHNDEYVLISELIETTQIYALTSMYFLNDDCQAGGVKAA